MQARQTDVSLIIISLNSKHFLEGCLQSIQSAAWRGYSWEVVVVDNGSTDGTLELLDRSWPEVRVIRNGRNLGYCKAGNQGAAIASGRYLFFLNDDIVILDDAVPKLIEFMDAHPKAGMIGSRLLNHDGTDQFSSGRAFTTPAAALFGRKSALTRWFPSAPWAKKYLMSDRTAATEPYEVDWLSAAAMMASREAFEAAGGLEESFYYFHEQIICKRMADAGYASYLHPTSKIIHFEGVGSGVRTRRVRRAHIRSFHTAAYQWFCLHHGISAWNPLRLLIAGVLSARAAFLMLLETVRPEAPNVVLDVNAGRPEGGIPV